MGGRRRRKQREPSEPPLPDDEFYSEEEEVKEKKTRTISVICVSIFVTIIAVIIAILRSIWYVSVIGSSFGQLAPIGLIPEDLVDVTGIKEAFGELADFLGTDFGSGLKALFVLIFDSVLWFDYSDLEEKYNAWSCYGGKAFISWIVLILLVVFVYLLLTKNFLFVIQIHWLKYRKNMGVGGKVMFQCMVKLLAGVLLYILQLLVLFMFSVIVKNFEPLLGKNRGRGCCKDGSPPCFDSVLYSVAPYIVGISMFFVLFWYIQLFGGRNKAISARQSIGAVLKLPFFCCFFPCRCAACKRWKVKRGLSGNLLFNSIMRVIYLTGGYWNDEMVTVFAIREMAAKYDDDDNDDDTRHEDVISIYGRSRGLLWMIVPGCAILATMAHLFNDPVLLQPITREETQPIVLNSPTWLRSIHFGFNVIRLILTVFVVFRPNKWILLFLILAVIPPVVVNMTWKTYETLRKKRADEEAARQGRRESREQARARKHGAFANIHYGDQIIIVPTNSEGQREIDKELRDMSDSESDPDGIEVDEIIVIDNQGAMVGSSAAMAFVLDEDEQRHHH